MAQVRQVSKKTSIIVNLFVWPPLLYFFAASLYYSHYHNGVGQEVFTPFVGSYIDEVRNTTQKARSSRITGPIVVIRADEKSVYSEVFECIPKNLVARDQNDVKVIAMVSYAGIRKAFVYDKLYAENGVRMAGFYHVWAIKIVDKSSRTVLLEMEWGVEPPDRVPEEDIDWLGVKKRKKLKFVEIGGEPGVIYKANIPPGKDPLRGLIMSLCGYRDDMVNRLLSPFQFYFAFQRPN